jgi:hypothetical protein
MAGGRPPSFISLHLGAGHERHGGVAVISRPIDRFPLRFKVGEDVVRVVFDNVVVEMAPLGATLGTRLNVNVRPSLLCSVGRPIRLGAYKCMAGCDHCVPALSRGHTASQVGSDMWLRSVCISTVLRRAANSARVHAQRQHSRRLR